MAATFAWCRPAAGSPMTVMIDERFGVARSCVARVWHQAGTSGLSDIVVLARTCHWWASWAELRHPVPLPPPRRALRKLTP